MINQVIRFLVDNIKSYNRFIIELLFNNSIGGKKISNNDNLSYNVYTAYLFVLFLLLTNIYCNSGYSFSFITGVISAVYGSFYAFSFFSAKDVEADEEKSGWDTFKKIIPFLFIGLIVILICFYFSEYAIDLVLLKKIFFLIKHYFFIFYVEGFFAFLSINIIKIDYPNIFEGKGFTLKNIIYYTIIYFFVWLADSIYSNIMKFGMEWSYWIFSIDSLIYIYQILAFIVFGLAISSWLVGVVEFLSKQENKSTSNWVHICLSIIIIMSLNYNNFIFYFFGLLVMYFVFFYVIRKIIPDYLRSYKYLNTILYLIFYLFFLSFIII